MKNITTCLAILFGLSLCLSLNSCKKEDVTVSASDVTEKLTTNLNTLRDAAILYGDVFNTTNDTFASIDTLVSFLLGQDAVSGGWYHNREFIEIEFANGLKSPLTIIPVGADGEHLSRGGGQGDELGAFEFKKKQTQSIKNNKALALIPYPSEFQYTGTDIQNLRNAFKSNDFEVEVEIEIGDEVDLTDLDRLDDFGLVILDVHGTKYGFDLIHLKELYDENKIWFPEDEIAEIFDVHSIPPPKIANGEIEIGLNIYVSKGTFTQFRFTVHITEEYIRQLNIDLSDVVVFGNHCYSGHTADGLTKNNLPQAWKSKGAACYYGYADVDGVSQPAGNDFCKRMEIALVKNLVSERKTTGEAHLDAEQMEEFYIPNTGFTRAKRVVLATLVAESPPAATPTWPLFFLQYFDEDYKYESDCDSTTSTDIKYQTTHYHTTSTRLKYFTECFIEVPYKEDAESYEFVWKEFSWSGDPDVGPSSTPKKWTNVSTIEGEEEVTGLEYIASEQVFRILGTAHYYDVGINASEDQIAGVINEAEADFKTIQAKVCYEICTE